MEEKEFKNHTLKKLNNLSDIELIEELDKATYGGGDVYRDLIKAILDKRLKITIQDLDRNTRNYSGRLIGLTVLLFFVALIQVFVSVMAIPAAWFIRISIFLVVVCIIYYIVRRITEEEDEKKSKN